jgi:hypothetical protein
MATFKAIELNMNNVFQYQGHPAYWIEVFRSEGMWAVTIDCNHECEELHIDTQYFHLKGDAELYAIDMAHEKMEKSESVKVVNQVYTAKGDLAYATSPEQFRLAFNNSRGDK